MPFLSSNEALVRAHRVDAILSEASLLLHDPALEAAFRVEAAILQDYFDNLYVPNIRGDRLETPKKYQDGASLPFVALSPAETFEADKTMKELLDYQRISVAHFLRDIGSPLQPNQVGEHLSERLDSRAMTISIKQKPTSYGMTAFSTTPYIFNGNKLSSPMVRYVLGRPNILFNLSANIEPVVSGIVVLHELVHADQMLSGTIAQFMNAEARKPLEDSDEAQARSYGSAAVRALYDNSTNPRYFRNDSFSAAFDRLLLSR